MKEIQKTFLFHFILFLCWTSKQNIIHLSIYRNVKWNKLIHKPFTKIELNLKQTIEAYKIKIEWTNDEN